MSVPERYCARGEQCKLYDPETGKPQKLSRYQAGDICESCRKARSDAEFEASQRAPSLKYERVKEKNPLKARLMILKRNLVAQMLARRGGYWEAIVRVRSRWRLDPVSTQLPPVSDDILYPPSVPTRRPPRPMKYILPPDIPNPHLGEPGDLEKYVTWLELRARWRLDLGDVLRSGVPERYLDEEPPPYKGWPSPQERSLPWYRFAAACVLFDPPLEEAAEFANYGGLALVPRENKDEPVLDVLTEEELREGAIDLRVQNAINNMIFEKAWELRSELGELDFRQAKREVLNRFKDYLEEESNRLTHELIEREIELDPPRRYYVEFVPGETSDKEVLKTLGVIRSEEGHAAKGGRRPNDELLPLLCALLLKKSEWRAPRVWRAS